MSFPASVQELNTDLLVINSAHEHRGCAEGGLAVGFTFAMARTLLAVRGSGDLKLHFFKAGLWNALFNV